MPLSTRSNATLFNVLYATLGITLFWIPVLLLQLTGVAFGILITYSLTKGLSHTLAQFGVEKHKESLSLFLIILLLSLFLYIQIIWLTKNVGDNSNTIGYLLNQMSIILDQVHTKLPAYISNYIPDTLQGLREYAIIWLKDNAQTLRLVGTHTLRGVSYLIIGIIIGGIMALQIREISRESTPLTVKLFHQFNLLVSSFVEVFSAQIRISFINTLLTSVYLIGILPLVGKALPMTSTIILITFISGLIPIIGNIISNTIITIISLSDSLTVAIISLVWLISIHKFEYFLNAKIIGHRIRATTWEILLCMLILESIFGLAGLISSPIIYAQIKRTLKEKNWII